MEQKVRRLVRLSAVHLCVVAVGLVVVLTPQPALADPTPSSAPSNTITVNLPTGVSLAPGIYEVVIRGSGGMEIKTKVKVEAPPNQQSGAPGAPSVVQVEPATAGESTDSRLPLLIALVLTLLALAGFLLHTRILVPRRSLRSYTHALALLSDSRYEQALPELTRLEGSLPTKRGTDAKFFIAFALYKLDNLDEAEHRLAALHREDPANVNVAYLLAHIHVGRRDYDRAEKVLEAIESSGQLGTGRNRKLYGVVKFHRALAAFREGRIDAAADLFERVEQLGDFRERIPADLRNRHVVLGTQALFEKDLHRARTQFEGLEQAARQLHPDQRDSMLASAKLGLALAAWIEDAPDSRATVEALLVDAARLLDPMCSLTQIWEEGTETADIAARLAALADGEGRSQEQRDRDMALRDIHFLRGLVVLRSWAGADRAAAAEAADTYLNDALTRFACARDRDPDFSDVYLVVGLLRYYLATTDQERAAGILLLRDAQKLGTRDPEVFQIVNQYDRLRELYRDAVDAYLETLDRYLRDVTVREQVRVDLRKRLSRYGKVRDWDSRPELINVRAVQPTVAEMSDRSLLLKERVIQLIASRPDTDDLAAAQDLTRRLEDEVRALSERAREVEQREVELLVAIGDQLLADSER